MPDIPNISLAVPFFMVRDMEASLKFYVGKLGFKMTRQWEPRGKVEWCWLERGAVAIMLQEMRDKPGQDELKGKGISICFQCTDALALYHEFKAKGVDIKEPFVGNSMWVIAFTDTDGYKLDFESPTGVSEETN